MSMSASPRLPISMAAPVPTATTSTWMPVFFSKIGRRYLNNPEFSVEVVEAHLMRVSADALPGHEHHAYR